MERRQGGYASKVMEIERMKKNPNPRFVIFSFCVSVCVCGGSRTRGGVGR